MADRPSLPPHASTLPARFYTDPALFAREQEIFFRERWTCVGRLEDIDAPGRFFTTTIAGDSVIVVNTGRETNGRPPVAAYYNVCRHRGTTLCTEAHGQLHGSIQCPYHAWTYGYDGALIGAPHMDGSPEFSRSDYPLRAVRADVWDGFVFVNASNTAPPLADSLASLPATFAPWTLGALTRGARLDYDIAANWKLILQNYSECLHCPNLHPALNKLSHYMSGDNEPLHQSYMGGRMDLSPGVESMSMDGRRVCDVLPGLDEARARQVFYYAIFPNLLISAHPDYVMVHTLQPIAHDRTHLACEFLFAAPALAQPAFSAVSVLEFWDMTNRQDWGVCELAQQGIGSRGYTPGPYSNREDLLYAFDRFIVNALGEPVTVSDGRAGSSD